VRPAVGHEAARRERHRVIRHRAFSTRRNFLPTYIRQRQSFSLVGRANEPFLATVTSAVVPEASLVATAGRAMIRGAPELATPVAAVLLPAVVGATDEERHDAPEARQLVDCNDRVQGSGCDRQKLGRTPRSVRQYDLSKARLWVYGRRLEGLSSSLHSFRCAPDHRAYTRRGPLLLNRALLPWLPVVQVHPTRLPSRFCTSGHGSDPSREVAAPVRWWAMALSGAPERTPP
jgi:hypothetical protein